MPKGHSGSHYNNLSFLQLLVSCSVVKFNLRRVNRIFPPNASLLTIINLLLSTKRALLGNEIQDPLKTSGKHRGLLCVQHLFRLHICLSARVHLQSWAASCRNSATCLFFLPMTKEAYLIGMYTLWSFWLPVGLAFSLKDAFGGFRDELLL